MRPVTLKLNEEKKRMTEGNFTILLKNYLCLLDEFMTRKKC